MWFSIVGFVVHLIFLISIFDIYFKSPIVSNIHTVNGRFPGPAKRLVLFVADGLRADYFYRVNNDGSSNAPYLRSVINSRGSWGVSHSRMPTETRPGHVSLIAGIYEDPSAIAKGWKENPIEFDSVFNQSRFTWMWGSPDVLPMFRKGASGSHVWMEIYDSHLEDFSGKTSTINLDKWVFEKFENFLLAAKTNDVLKEKLQQDGIVFFLHLLGLDTAGHSHKPHSLEYKINIKAVDDGIKKVENLISEFYNNDGKTAFLFTSDHGMTDWGSHGSGDISETETPLVAWGAGVRQPILESDKSDEKSPEDWKLSHLKRSDVMQADIAPLMSTLIGIPIPVNSVGILPRAYLNFSDIELNDAMYVNAQQMLAHYNRKREIVEEGTLQFLYSPFLPLTVPKQFELLSKFDHYSILHQYDASMKAADLIISLSLSGLDYYHNYYQTLLLTCITFAYLGWMVWLLLTLMKPYFIDVKENSHHAYQVYAKKKIWLNFDYILNTFFLTCTLVAFFFIKVQNLPVQFYIYCILPVILWWIVARQYHVFIAALKKTKLLEIFTSSMLYFIGIEILVLSFFYRYILSFGVLGLALWALFSKNQRHTPLSVKAGWLLSCSFLVIFPILPVIGGDANIQLVCCSGCLWILFSIICMLQPEYRKDSSRVFYVLILQLLSQIAVIWNVYNTSSNIESKQGLPLFNQILSWLLLGLSFVFPLLSSRWLVPRIMSIMLSFSLPFLLMSASHEGLFLLALVLTLCNWICLEHHAVNHKQKLSEYTVDSNDVPSKQTVITSSNFRRAFIFLFFIILSFFGTGNIANLNSFDPTWVRCFVTVFSPFTMTILILLKTTVPFLNVTCTFRAINIVVQAPVQGLFLIILMFCDAMGLHFLHLVTNQGSWADIGISLSHFVIMHVIILILVILYFLATFLTCKSLWTVIDIYFLKSYNKSKKYSNHKHKGPSLECAGSQLIESHIRQRNILFRPLYKKYCQ